MDVVERFRVGSPRVVGTSSRLLFDVLAQVYDGLGFAAVGDAIGGSSEPDWGCDVPRFGVLQGRRADLDLGHRPRLDRSTTTSLRATPSCSPKLFVKGSPPSMPRHSRPQPLQLFAHPQRRPMTLSRLRRLREPGQLAAIRTRHYRSSRRYATPASSPRRSSP